MKILNAEQISRVDQYTIENKPISSIDLMEHAAQTCTDWITKKYRTGEAHTVYIFVGPGNNGGDGLAIARMLANLNYNVAVYVVTDRLSPNSLINRDRLLEQNKVKLVFINTQQELPSITPQDIIIDALYGSGLNSPVGGFPARVIKHLNRSKAVIIAIDIPSGLFGEDNSQLRDEALYGQEYINVNQPPKDHYDNVIQATYTLTFQTPFLSFFFAENAEHVGEWIVLPIGLDQDYMNKIESNYHYVTADEIKPKIITRKKFAHKGTYGHALLITGSYGKMGAAILASRACLRAGVGLLTTHIPKFGYDIMQTAVPEAMLSIDKYNKVSSEVPYISNYTAIGIGPGIGKSSATQTAVKSLLEKATVPMLFDADAINIIAESSELIDKLPPNSILTPHPKEFERLAGKSENNFARNKIQIEFAIKHKVYVVLKGAYTAIACPDGSCYFNTTGNPGMATAGSGDALSGIIVALLAQAMAPKDACLLGVYIHGLAGDIAAEKTGQESLIAGDIIDNLCYAFQKLK